MNKSTHILPATALALILTLTACAPATTENAEAAESVQSTIKESPFYQPAYDKAAAIAEGKTSPDNSRSWDPSAVKNSTATRASTNPSSTRPALKSPSNPPAT